MKSSNGRVIEKMAYHAVSSPCFDGEVDKLAGRQNQL